MPDELAVPARGDVAHLKRGDRDVLVLGGDAQVVQVGGRILLKEAERAQGVAILVVAVLAEHPGADRIVEEDQAVELTLERLDAGAQEREVELAETEDLVLGERLLYRGEPVPLVVNDVEVPVGRAGADEPQPPCRRLEHVVGVTQLEAGERDQTAELVVLVERLRLFSAPEVGVLAPLEEGVDGQLQVQEQPVLVEGKVALVLAAQVWVPEDAVLLGRRPAVEIGLELPCLGGGGRRGAGLEPGHLIRASPPRAPDEQTDHQQANQPSLDAHALLLVKTRLPPGNRDGPRP